MNFKTHAYKRNFNNKYNNNFNNNKQESKNIYRLIDIDDVIPVKLIFKTQDITNLVKNIYKAIFNMDLSDKGYNYLLNHNCIKKINDFNYEIDIYSFNKYFGYIVDLDVYKNSLAEPDKGYTNKTFNKWIEYVKNIRTSGSNQITIKFISNHPKYCVKTNFYVNFKMSDNKNIGAISDKFMINITTFRSKDEADKLYNNVLQDFNDISNISNSNDSLYNKIDKLFNYTNAGSSPVSLNNAMINNKINNEYENKEAVELFESLHPDIDLNSCVTKARNGLIYIINCAVNTVINNLKSDSKYYVATAMNYNASMTYDNKIIKRPYMNTFRKFDKKYDKFITIMSIEEFVKNLILAFGLEFINGKDDYNSNFDYNESDDSYTYKKNGYKFITIYYDKNSNIMKNISLNIPRNHEYNLWIKFFIDNNDPTKYHHININIVKKVECYNDQLPYTVNTAKYFMKNYAEDFIDNIPDTELTEDLYKDFMNVVNMSFVTDIEAKSSAYSELFKNTFTAIKSIRNVIKNDVLYIDPIEAIIQRDSDDYYTTISKFTISSDEKNKHENIANLIGLLLYIHGYKFAKTTLLDKFKRQSTCFKIINDKLCLNIDNAKSYKIVLDIDEKYNLNIDEFINLCNNFIDLVNLKFPDNKEQLNYILGKLCLYTVVGDCKFNGVLSTILNIFVKKANKFYDKYYNHEELTINDKLEYINYYNEISSFITNKVTLVSCEYNAFTFANIGMLNNISIVENEYFNKFNYNEIYVYACQLNIMSYCLEKIKNIKNNDKNIIFNTFIYLILTLKYNPNFSTILKNELDNKVSKISFNNFGWQDYNRTIIWYFMINIAIIYLNNIHCKNTRNVHPLSLGLFTVTIINKISDNLYNIVHDNTNNLSEEECKEECMEIIKKYINKCANVKFIYDNIDTSYNSQNSNRFEDVEDVVNKKLIIRDKNTFEKVLNI